MDIVESIERFLTEAEREKGVRAMMVEACDEIVLLRRDKKRIDWLADKHNNIGDVKLPIDCVRNNPESLRDAIDEAMKFNG